MSLKEAFKNEAREEREKLRNMTLKDKIWYIWEYYKFFIIGVVCAVGIIISVGTTMYNNRFDTALYCVVINNRTSEAGNQNQVLEELKDYLNLSDVREIVYDSSMFISYGDNTNELGYATMAKISALVASRELDIMIADTDSIDNYAKLGGMTNLEEILPADLYEKVKDRIYYTMNEEGVSQPCAVSLEDTKFAADMNLVMEPPLIALFSNSEHTENCIALLHYIFD
ncbi:hypothetical protein C0033_08245 [Clostridium sp. chh4-2]|uniref:hypothetical protein n=1 Tax=Clostridium sp. chh4-2 TaxID=2067550 RepID=UPI000CCE1D0B|nr:hypothetical protein [Clostridium sp. chh4-2]PNV62542.1 hypothetical protein C0033_08245 [Clostridium sp. chh4-2]